MMKNIRIIISVLVIANLEGFQLAYGQDLESEKYSHRLKSEKRALSYSLLGTLTPVSTGIIWWAADGYETKVKSYTVNEKVYTRSYRVDPDRTVPVCLILTGIAVGPSAGYFYAGRPWRGVSGILLRVGTGAATRALIDMIVKSSEGGGGFGFSFPAAAGLIGLAGVTAIIVEVVVDIKNVRTVVKERNSKIQNKTSNITLAPRYFADSGAGGLELNITF
jgi:hypothetical protein